MPTNAPDRNSFWDVGSYPTIMAPEMAFERMTSLSSLLGAESREVPAVLERQGQVLVRQITDLVGTLRRRPPQVIVTCGRGSSAHAATFGKHLFERYLGLPVAAAAPVVASVYHRSLDLRGQLFLVISQSGRSTDLIATAEMARSGGAITAAIVNDTNSPLARTCEYVLSMEAGPELSVAASKTFVASLAALLRLSAEWTDDSRMREALARLPQRLRAAIELDWSAALPRLSRAHSVITIGRGPTLAIAREVALKLKEVCNIHAEAFSSAEFQHGPISLVEQTYPILIFAPTDAAAEGSAALQIRLLGEGAEVFAAGQLSGAGHLPTLQPDQPEADAICLIQTFYQLLPQLASTRGSDVDRPRHLQKVTSTR
jgi:glucosamine--fructose-6-phosphate aminotransferase (isomerizing)